MKTIEYIREHGVEKLKEELGIIVKEYQEGLMVLNYNQIESPKTNPIVMECRGLILDSHTLEVVSRGFDRFFNHGEAPEHSSFDFEEAEVCEKVDGSFIKIYNHLGQWFIATRGTAFAESECNGFSVSFRDLVLRALPDSTVLHSNGAISFRDNYQAFQEECDFWLDPDWTYIFEFTSMENRVVTRYDGYNLTYLASRHNKTGEYGDSYEENAAVNAFSCKVAKRYKFDTIENCLDAVKNLPDMQEGYVVYVRGVPVCKIKSPAYLVAHRIRGEGLSPKRIMQLVLMNEVDEYVAYFEEDKKFFDPYVSALETGIEMMKEVFERYKEIEDQKKYALAVNGYDFSAILFKARSTGKKVSEVFHSQTEQAKMRLLSHWVEASF